MASEHDTNRTSTSTSGYVSLGSAYFLAVGVLYLWGYWARFDINILEYLGLPDVIKLTAYPIASAFVFTFVGMVLGEIMVGGRLPYGGGRDTPVGIFLNRHKGTIVGAYVVGTTLLFFYGPDEKWEILPFFLSWPVYFAAKEADLLDEIRNDSARSVVIFVISILPFWAYGHGRIEAVHVHDGTKYKYLAESIPGVKIDDPAKEKNRYKYLGHAGGFIFLLAPDAQSTVIVPFEKIEALRVKERLNKSLR